MDGEEKRGVGSAAIEELFKLINAYAEELGAEPTEKLCIVLSKVIVWLTQFGTGSVEANAKDHVFSERLITQTYD